MREQKRGKKKRRRRPTEKKHVDEREIFWGRPAGAVDVGAEWKR